MTGNFHAFKISSVKSLFWGVTQNWGSECISFLVFLALARLLVPNDFGLVALASVYTGLLSILISQGFVPALVRLDRVTSLHWNSVFWTNAMSSTALLVVTWLVQDPLSRLFREPSLAPLFTCLMLKTVLEALSLVPRAQLMRQLQFRTLALQTLTATLVGGLTGITLAGLGAGYWSLVGQQLCHTGLTLLLLILATSWRPGWRFSFASLREVLGISFDLFGANFLLTSRMIITNFAVGFFCGTSVLGFYRVSKRIVNLVQKAFIQSFGDTSLSLYVKLRCQPERLIRAFLLHNRFVTMLCAPFLAIFFLGAETLTRVLIGPEWLPAVPLIQFLVVLTVPTAFNGGVWPLLQACGNTRRILLVRSIQFIGGLVILFALIPQSLFLALIGQAGWNLTVFFILYYEVARVVPPEDLFRLVRMQIPNVGATTALVLIWSVGQSWGIDPSALPAFLLLSAMGGVTFLLTLFIFSPSQITEMGAVLKLLRKKPLDEDL